MDRVNAWTTYGEAELKELEKLSKDYKEFLSNGKTERECVKQSIKLAQAAGYQDLEELIKNNTPLKAGDKVYRTWMEKTIALFQIGEEPLEDGLNILGAHIDSPRLDLFCDDCLIPDRRRTIRRWLKYFRSPYRLSTIRFKTKSFI